MKKHLISGIATVVAMTFLSGCAWQVGGGAKNATIQPTVGQQLIDLQKAKEAGAITEAEYQAQKAKVLEHKPGAPQN